MTVNRVKSFFTGTGASRWLRTGCWMMLALLIAALLAWVDGKNAWLSSFFAYSVILLVSFGIITAGIGLTSAGRAVQIIALVAFTLRLAVGAFLTVMLPTIGYPDSEESQAGYIYQDAMIRDQQAWELAASGDSLWTAFSERFSGDQYGGLLALSGLIYRVLSPDHHRSILIILLTSMVSAWGVLLMWRAVRDWLTGDNKHGLGKSAAEWIALASAWIVALYPEGIFFSANPMREPFVIAAAATAFYGYVLISKKQRSGWIWVASTLLLLLPIQTPATLAIFITLLGVYILEPGRRFSWRSLAFTVIGIALVMVLMLVSWKTLPSLRDIELGQLIWTWFKYNFGFQTHLLERSSGWVQEVFRSLGDRWRIPFVMGYGFLQPLLPATIVEPMIPVWRVFHLLRSLGWYLMAPLLVYGMITTFITADSVHRRQRIWLVVVVFAWIFIAALNAGGDQWDNPRYRVMFLTWQSLLTAWTIFELRSKRKAWLIRILIVEILFVLLFVYWYLARYFLFSLPNPGLFGMVGITAVVSVLIIGGGWLWDLWRKQSKEKRAD